MQVVFRCKRSGNTVSFSLPADIDGLRKHEGYEEVKEIENGVQEIQRQEAPAQVTEPAVPVIRAAKAKGRPRKVKE
jgi:hypothetical protein